MVSKNLLSKKHNPKSRLGNKISKLLKKKGALPICAIKGILEEKLGKRINRRRLYRKMEKLRRWNKVRKTTERKTSYFRVVEKWKR